MKATKKSALKILKGGRDEANLSGIGPDNFLWAKATNTRLMGVVGVKVCWKVESGDIFYQFFHLDSETYGIDGYESLVNPNTYEVEYITLHMTGGLGGVFKSISYNELIYLLKWSYALNIKEDEPLPDGWVEFEKLLRVSDTACDAEALMARICEHVENEAQCIHYFLMRIFGGDYSAAGFLMDSIAEDNISQYVSNGILLRNEVSCKRKSKRGRFYQAESLVDTASGYMIVHSELNIVQAEAGYRIRMANKLEDMHVSNIEAAFLLKKPEYLAIYEIDSLEEFLMVFKIENPAMMNSMHEAGVLFTCFNKDNDHVKKDLYYLNGDIHSVYFITRGDQLIVASFEKEKMEEAKAMLSGNAYGEMLVEDDSMLIEEPVFYEFVNSGEEDIYDFFN